MAITLKNIESSNELAGNALGGGFLDLSAKWKTFSVRISAEQRDTIKNFKWVLEIIGGYSKSPSQIAELKGKVCPFIELIDRDYRLAMNRYKDLLVIATGLDEAFIAKRKETNTFLTFFTDLFTNPDATSAATGFSSITGGAATGLMASSGPLGVGAGALLFFIGACIKRYQKNEQIAVGGSVERIAALGKISNKEVKRFNNIQEKISNRLGVLKENLEALSADGETNIDMLEEFKQLETVSKALIGDSKPNSNKIQVIDHEEK